MAKNWLEMVQKQLLTYFAAFFLPHYRRVLFSRLLVFNLWLIKAKIIYDHLEFWSSKIPQFRRKNKTEKHFSTTMSVKNRLCPNSPTWPHMSTRPMHAHMGIVEHKASPTQTNSICYRHAECRQRPVRQNWQLLEQVSLQLAAKKILKF